jgi:hypothetical protein
MKTDPQPQEHGFKADAQVRKTDAPAGLRGVDLIARAVAAAPESKRIIARIVPAALRTTPQNRVRSSGLDVVMLLPNAKREAVLRGALDAAKPILAAGVRSSVFRDVAPFLPDGEREAALRNELAAARATTDKEERAAALISVAPFLPEGEREAVLREALAATPAKAYLRTLLEAYKAESHSTVENSEISADNPPDMDQSPDIGGATLEQAQTLLGQVIGKIGFSAVAKMIVEAASPDDRALLAGMVARGRELTGRAPAPVEEPAQETKTEAQVRAKKPVARPPSRVKHSFFEVSRPTNLRHRHSALVEHYEGRTAWEDWKGEADPTPDDFNKWLDSWASDRRRVGLLYSDLRYLDWSAYVKLKNWKKRDSGVSKKVIASFGLPTKIKTPRPRRVVRSKRSSPVGQSVAL